MDRKIKHTHHMRKLILSLIVMIFFGCYPVSHIIVGETRSPISPSKVKIYLEYPEEYEIIARIDASSEFAFRDPSFDITWQSKMDKMIQRLKIEAAQLGANGIVIEGTTNQTRQNMRAEENGTSISESHYKTGTATAIFVKTF